MRKFRRNNSIYMFVVLILFVCIGYALLGTDLKINGSSLIESVSWNVYWNNIQIKEGSVTDVTTPATIKPGKTVVEFNVNLNQPGDYYEFTVDAVNDGSIDAMIGDLTKGIYAVNGVTPKPLPEYLEYTVTYTDDSDIEENHLLEAGHTETYKVRVYYKEDIDSSK